MSRNQPRTPPDRSRFLHPPLEDPETLRLLEQAEDRLQQFLPSRTDSHPRNQLIWTEARPPPTSRKNTAKARSPGTTKHWPPTSRNP